jgi:hypothetical protein
MRPLGLPVVRVLGEEAQLGKAEGNQQRVGQLGLQEAEDFSCRRFSRCPRRFRIGCRGQQDYEDSQGRSGGLRFRPLGIGCPRVTAVVKGSAMLSWKGLFGCFAIGLSPVLLSWIFGIMAVSNRWF